NVVCVPLHHFTSAFEILGVVVCATNTVFVQMGQLHFDPGRIKALLMQNGTHGMPKTVAGSLAIITDAFDHHVDTGLTHRFVDIAAPWKYQLVLTSVGTEFLQDRQNLI